MNSIFKLCNSSSQLKLIQQNVRSITLKPVTAPTGSVHEGHAVRNERLNRPLSPHLTIYKLQITSVLSVTHRATGIALAGYGIGLAGVGLISDMTSILTLVESLGLSSATLFAGKFILAFPVAFHTANGVRHLVWDTGRALTIKKVYATGYAMLGGTAVLTFILALL